MQHATCTRNIPMDVNRHWHKLALSVRFFTILTGARRQLGSPRPLALLTNSCRKHSGSRDIRVTQNVPHNLRPCAFAQHTAGMHGAEAPKMPFNARIGRVRTSAKSGCKRSRAKWTAGVYVRNLPSRRLGVRLWESKDRREFRPYAARRPPWPYPRFARDH